MTEGTQAPAAPAAPAPETPAAPPADAPKPSRFDLMRSDRSLEEIKAEISGKPAPVAEGETTDDAGQQPPAEGQPPASEAGAETTAAGGETQGDAPPAEPVVLKLSGRRPGDPEVQVPVDAAAARAAGLDLTELQERLAQAQNTVGRYSTYVERLNEVEARRAELVAIESRLEKPDTAADFLLEYVGEPIRLALVEKLLAGFDDKAFEQLVDRVSGLAGDPVARREERVKQREDALARQKKAAPAEASQITPEDRRQAGLILKGIADLAPDAWPESRRARFLDVSRRALMEYVEQQDIQELDPTKVPQVLGRLGILDDYGLSAAASADPAPPASPASRAQIERAQQTAEEIRKRKERRDNAATAPAGAGPVLPDGNRPPKGQTPEERFAWIRGTARK